MNSSARIHAVFLTLSRAMAGLGGAVLCALVLITCASVLGRQIDKLLNSAPVQSAMPGLADWLLARGIGPITGDFELVELGMGFVIFAFLPLCQIQSAHARVDILAERLSQRSQRVLGALAEGIFAAILVVIAWQLAIGTMGRMQSGQNSFLLAIPLWWAYAAALVAAMLAAAVGLYMAVMRLRELAAGRALLPDPEG